MSKNEYTVSYNIYRVVDRLRESGINCNLPSNTEWEYEVYLLDNNKEVISFDSWFETYIGGKHLSYKLAKKACAEIKHDVEYLGEVDRWFPFL